MYDDFIDLRSPDISSESFWPSFTDIMMVVVMIFLLTSTILMVRNWELVDQLRNSIMAEQQASEIIKFTSQENATLEEQLVNAQNEISMLRLELMHASEQTSSLQDFLAERDNRILILSSDNQKMQNTLLESDRQITDLSSQVRQLHSDLGSMRLDVAQQAKELKESRDQIIFLSREKESQTAALHNLETSYSSLKIKYEKLIKPARTAKGKHIVEVHYQRKDGVEIIRYKDTADADYRELSSEELHEILAKAKQEHQNTLYIKIIIPKQSGLSYSEAWNFMKNLLDKYDYYYQ